MSSTRLKQIGSFQRETIRDEQFVRVIPNNRPDYTQEDSQGG